MTTIPPDRLQQALLRQDLPSFIAKAMATLEPGTPYDENWHVLHLAGQLNRVRAGELRRLMVNLPPRSLKSHIVSIAYVAWLLGHDPGKRIICITYGQELARQQAALFRRLVESPWYRALFPACVPAQPNRLLDWTTTRGGYRLATSIDGSILGRGADLIILDDPNKGQEIFSRTARQRVHHAYDQTIATRLNNPQLGAIILVMQRLHQDDLAGHVLTQEPWVQIVIPAIAEEDEVWDLGNGRVHRRPAGEPLQPSRMGHTELDIRRRAMGPTAFQAQYQQHPVPDDGVVIKRGWLRYYDTPPETFDLVVVSWDTASTLSDDADWSVGTVWGVSARDIYLLRVERARLEAPDLQRRIEAVHREEEADITLIEDADLGRGIAQGLRRTSGYCFPHLVQPRIDKVARMQARAVMFETGKVLLPRTASWLPVYLEELLGFPNSRHDDQVDSTSQALDYLQRRFAEPPVMQRPRHVMQRPSGRLRPSIRRAPA
jgi:predicted phage terminase large subunit-like protein